MAMTFSIRVLLANGSPRNCLGSITPYTGTQRRHYLAMLVFEDHYYRGCAKQSAEETENNSSLGSTTYCIETNRAM